MASQTACATNNSPRLEGKVAIVTGGASGIGETTVRVFVENGAMVVIGDIQDDKASMLVNELGPHVVAYRHCDISIEHDMEALVAFTLTKWGKLDIMFNNAGILDKYISTDVTKVDANDFDNVMSVNVRGTVLGVKHASKAMVDAKIKGSIICTSSIAGIRGGVAPMAYVVSKHAILGIMRAACSDLGKYGIRVNCVSPGLVVTPLSLRLFSGHLSDSSMTTKIDKALNEKSNYLANISLSTLDIAYAALFLASDDSKSITGLNLVVDEGTTSINHSFLYTDHIAPHD